MGLHNSIPIRGDRSRFYVGASQDFDSMQRFFGTSDMSFAAQAAQSVDVTGHDDNVSISGRARNPQVSITQSIATPAHQVSKMFDDAAANRTQLWCIIRSAPELEAFAAAAAVASAGAALVAESGATPAHVDITGSAPPDLTLPAYGINQAIKIGNNYYPFEKISSATEADVSGVTADAAAAIFSIVLPQYQIGPFQVDVTGSAVEGLTIPSGEGAVWNGTVTLQALSRPGTPTVVTG